MPAEFSADFGLAQVERGIAETRFSGRVRHLASAGSTNQLALEAAASGVTCGVWVADEQTAGRGRGGHSWHSAVGDGLYASALVTPRLPMERVAVIPLAAGLAAQAAIRETTGLEIDLRWPNDLMFGERKCGGILVESASETDRSGARLRFAVIGIGINVNHTEFPLDLRRIATSLAQESGRSFERDSLLGSLLRHLDRELGAMENSGLSRGDDGNILKRFALASSWVSGKRVRVGEGDGYTGVTCGLDAQGFLQVKSDDGARRTVYSGGVRSSM